MYQFRDEKMKANEGIQIAVMGNLLLNILPLLLPTVVEWVTWLEDKSIDPMSKEAGGCLSKAMNISPLVSPSISTWTVGSRDLNTQIFSQVGSSKT